MAHSLQGLIDRFPEGYSTGMFRGVSFGITKTIFNAGRSTKWFAEALDGTDFVSFNLYQTERGETLKPCEMPADKVIAFLEEVEPVPAQ